MTKKISNSKNSSNKENTVALFEQKEIRRVWDEKEEKWYFSIVDIVEVLTEAKDYQAARNYWKVLKSRLKKEGNETVTNCNQLKLMAKDGKARLTDVSDTKGILRIIQSVPSKKAEPFKLWLAKVGSERIDEINDPELAGKRMHDLYLQKGYSEAWVHQRERGIVSRNSLTDEWRKRGAHEGLDYAILTNEIYKTGFNLTANEYKSYKGIAKQRNLRDSMTEIELALTNLGEVTAKELHKENDSFGLLELKKDVKNAGKAVKGARREVEKQVGHSVVSKTNYLDETRQKRLS
ncbi:Bro-N domain-containing protein [Candidatus Saccharibacteria bacterium]|nr:Bro-N domain-containing protein [Candidatus Saccharibacteria bacterium]